MCKHTFKNITEQDSDLDLVVQHQALQIALMLVKSAEELTSKHRNMKYEIYHVNNMNLCLFCVNVYGLYSGEDKLTQHHARDEPENLQYRLDQTWAEHMEEIQYPANRQPIFHCQFSIFFDFIDLIIHYHMYSCLFPENSGKCI